MGIKIKTNIFLFFIVMSTILSLGVSVIAQETSESLDIINPSRELMSPQEMGLDDPAFSYLQLPGNNEPFELENSEPSELLSKYSESNVSSEITENRDDVIKEVSLDLMLEEGESASLDEKKADRISLDLKGIEITEFFRILSLKMGVTIVPSKNVSGRVNIFLNNLTFEDSLDVILLSQDLAAERKGSIINIMTSAEYERLYGKKYNEKRIYKNVKLRYAEPSAIFNAISQIKSDIGKIIVDESTGMILIIDIPEKVDLIVDTIKKLDQSLVTEIFDIQYADSDTLKTQLSAAMTSGTGELYVDQRSGKLLISDLPDKMEKLKRMVAALDIPPQQVFIEAEIIQVDISKEFQRDIDWTRLLSGANIDSLDIKGTFPVSPSFSPSPDLSTSNVELTVGTLASDNYNATMRFLESIGNAKILSRPRIAAINGQEAKILVGTREAYITSTQSQADTTTITSESVEFIDVGIKLSVLPVINSEGYITLSIKPEISSVKDTITTQVGSRVPIVSTSEAETTVKVKDGTMIMIAGLMEDVERESTSGIPGLKNLPFVGYFFGSKANQSKRSEVIVFLTPHIFSGAEGARYEDVKTILSPEMLPEDILDRFIIDEIDAIEPRKQNEDPVKNILENQLPSYGAEQNSINSMSRQLKGLKEI